MEWKMPSSSSTPIAVKRPWMPLNVPRQPSTTLSPNSTTPNSPVLAPSGASSAWPPSSPQSTPFMAHALPHNQPPAGGSRSGPVPNMTATAGAMSNDWSALSLIDPSPELLAAISANGGMASSNAHYARLPQRTATAPVTQGSMLASLAGHQRRSYAADLSQLAQDPSSLDTGGLPPSLWMSPASANSSSPTIRHSQAPNVYQPLAPNAAHDALFIGPQPPAPPAASTSSKSNSSNADTHAILSEILSDDLFHPQLPASASNYPSPNSGSGGSPEIKNREVTPEELTDLEALASTDPLATQVWRMYAKTKASLPHGQRMENLTWRMMALHLKKKAQDAAASANANAIASSSTSASGATIATIKAIPEVKQEQAALEEPSALNAPEVERGRSANKGKAKVRVEGFDGDEQITGEEDVNMDWRAFSRSRSRMSMDWRPMSRSRSRVTPAQFQGEPHAHMLLQQGDSGYPPFPLFGSAPGMRYPGLTEEPAEYGGMSLPNHVRYDDLSFGERRAPNGVPMSANGVTFPIDPSQQPALPFPSLASPGFAPSSLPSFGGLNLMLPTSVAPEFSTHPDVALPRVFPRHVRKTSFDHTVSRDGIVPGDGRHQVNGRPMPPDLSSLGKRRADTPHSDSMMRADPANLRMLPDPMDPYEDGATSEGGPFPSAPFSFHVPRYEGLFDFPDKNFRKPMQPVLRAFADPTSASDSPESATGSSSEPLSATTSSSSYTVSGDPYGDFYQSYMYPQHGPPAHHHQQQSSGASAYTHVDPTQLLSGGVEFGGAPRGSGIPTTVAIHPSPSDSDGWAHEDSPHSTATPPPLSAIEQSSSGNETAKPKAAQSKRSDRPASSVNGGAGGQRKKNSGGETSASGALGSTNAHTGENGDETPTVCKNCSTTNTPLWRRDPDGQPLCNACGLFFKLHGVERPLSLKTDVIKKRNRASGNPNSSRKGGSSTLPKIASTSNRPRSNTAGSATGTGTSGTVPSNVARGPAPGPIAPSTSTQMKRQRRSSSSANTPSLA